MKTLISAMIICLAASVSQATTYHVIPTGDDGAGDGSSGNPWRTISHSIARMAPGDVLYLEPGTTFVESVYFGPGSGGTAGSPITLTSDPANRPTLTPGGTGSNALSAYNSGHIVLSNLKVVGAGSTVSSNSGLSFYVDGGQQGLLRFENLEVTGFGANGLVIGGWQGVSNGYNGIQIENCRFHHNRTAGFFCYGQYKTSHRNLAIRNSISDNNTHGDGLLINGVTNGLVEHCTTHDNGVQAGGRIGIWTYGVDGVTIQYCESYNNRTNGTDDGGGFDFDGGTVNSLMQYNYSHGNDGAGFGVYQYSGAATAYGPLENNIIRYNLSVNDGRKNSYGALGFWGATATDSVGPNEIYNNTVYVGGTVTNGTPSAVRYTGTNVNGLRLRNNLFIVANGYRLINSDGALVTTRSLHQGNNWWPVAGTSFQLKFGTTTYTSLAAWRTATGNERLDGSDVGFNIDPRLVAPGSLTATDYMLRFDSPLIDASLDLPVSRGGFDYFSNTIPQGVTYDIGAHDTRPTVTALATRNPASEFTGSTAELRVSRTGATLKPLTVSHTLAGSASNGTDYASVPGSTVIPAGATEAAITITPIADQIAEGLETVRLQPAAGTLYTASPGTSAQVEILDTPADHWRFTKFAADANTPAIAGDSADPDADGLMNLLEYAFGTEPKVPSPGNGTVVDASGAYLTLRAAKNPDATDIQWAAESCGTLAPGDWTRNVTELPNDPTTYQVRDNVPIIEANARFLRILVSRVMPQTP